jgi:hypothetical protein
MRKGQAHYNPSIHETNKNKTKIKSEKVVRPMNYINCKSQSSVPRPYLDEFFNTPTLVVALYLEKSASSLLTGIFDSGAFLGTPVVCEYIEGADILLLESLSEDASA